MLTIVDYKEEHLKQIKIKKCHEGEFPKTVCTRAVTLLNGESPIAIIGSFTFITGVMHVWAIVSEEANQVPIQFFKACTKLLNYYEQKDKPRRTQIDIKYGHSDLEKWANKIGFKREGLMKSYGPDGSDYWLFGRVNQWAL